MSPQIMIIAGVQVQLTIFWTGTPGGSSTPGPRCSVEGETDMSVQGVGTTLFWRHGPVQTDHGA